MTTSNTATDFQYHFSRKILVLVSVFLALPTAWTAYAQTLQAGDLAIIGVGVDDEEVLLVALSNIPAGESVFFTDEEWSGSSFSSGEGFYEWVTPAISAGDVITLTDTSSTAGGTVTQQAGSFALSNSGDGVFLYQTSTNTYNAGTYILLAFAGEDSGDAGTLTGTGLTLGEHAVYFGGDNGLYNGTRTGQTAAEFRALIYNSANWTTSGSAQTFDTTDFTVVTGGTASALRVSSVNGGTSPSAGTAFDVVVESVDGDGNPANVSGDVSVSLSVSTGSLTGATSGTISDGTSTVTISGVVYASTATGLTITAADASAGLTAGTSSSFDVVAAADQLVIAGLSSTGLSSPVQQTFSVQAQRSSDNSIDVNYTRNITISKATGPGSLGGTLTVAAANGTASFTTVTFSAPGAYTLTAADGSLTSAASSTITISEAPSLVINEILADPDATNGDANGDGTVSTSQDEFVEIVNTGSSSIDLAGWTLSDGFGIRHTFADPSVIESGQAVVIFSGGTPTGDFGNAVVLTASSGGTGFNNGGDDVILKDGAGNVIASVTYGSEGGNNVALTRSPDLTGDFVAHSTADTENSTLFSPGKRLDYSNFRKVFTMVGSEGWRMVSSPVDGATYDDLLGPFWTQGIATGADVTEGTANVYTYDGTQFQAVDDLTQPIPTGQGFIFYAFSDDDHTNSDANAGFPKSVVLTGTENATDISPAINDGDDAWTMVGNPFNATLDHTAFTKGNGLYSPVYAWDPAAGFYKSHNGTDGTLTDGLIHPFHGFWVQNTTGAGTRSLTIRKNAKRRGGRAFHKAPNTPVLALQARMDHLSSPFYVTFAERGLPGLDRGDALKLEPLEKQAPYLQFGAVLGDRMLDIANLPVEVAAELAIPLDAVAFTPGDGGWQPLDGRAALELVKFQGIPADWQVELLDSQTMQRVELHEGAMNRTLMQMQLAKGAAKERPSAGSLGLASPRAEATSSQTEFRYHLLIRSQSSVGTETGGLPLPKTVQLNQNFPNPFNPATEIRFSLPQAEEVTLRVFDLLGREVAAPYRRQMMTAGWHTFTFDASELPSGTYLYRLETSSGATRSQQMTLLK